MYCANSNVSSITTLSFTACVVYGGTLCLFKIYVYDYDLHIDWGKTFKQPTCLTIMSYIVIKRTGVQSKEYGLLVWFTTCTAILLIITTTWLLGDTTFYNSTRPTPIQFATLLANNNKQCCDTSIDLNSTFWLGMC